LCYNMFADERMHLLIFRVSTDKKKIRINTHFLENSIFLPIQTSFYLSSCIPS
jgi:hypothetical protein